MGRGDEIDDEIDDEMDEIDEMDDDEMDDEIDDTDEIDDDETEGASGGTRIGQRNFEFGIARTDSPRLPALAPSWSLVVCVSRDAFPGMRVQKFELEYSQRGTGNPHTPNSRKFKLPLSPDNHASLRFLRH
jgi:hypothetical protein